MKLTIHPFSNAMPSVRPAPAERDWMEATHEGFAKRCLPLNIANAHGWEILCGRTMAAIWDGGHGKKNIKLGLLKDDPEPKDNYVKAMSHFGAGVLTFELPMLFRTPPGWNLMVTGPINRPKDAISPLTGIIETDWSPYTFTMNWKFTRPDTQVIFRAGEPIAHVMPVQRGALAAFEPEVTDIATDPEFAAQHEEWRLSRGSFNTGLQKKEPEAVAAKWQKGYFQGRQPDGSAGSPDHETKVRLSPLADKRQRTSGDAE